MHSRRVEALGDGIFAIAMTLLVLELKVPALAATGSPGELAKALLLMWPKFAGYGGSFGRRHRRSSRPRGSGSSSG